MKEANSTACNMADGIPGIGHAKGLVHYVRGDVEGGNKAIRAATRTMAVMGAGAGGFVVGGPAGAVAYGVTAGGGWDMATAAVTGGEETNGIAKIFQNPKSVDSYFNAGLSIVSDGFAGHSGGKIVKNSFRSCDSGGKKPEKVSGSGKSGGTSKEQQSEKTTNYLVNDDYNGKISQEEFKQGLDKTIPQEIPVEINLKELIPDLLYYQTMREMANAEFKETVVMNPSSSECLSSKSSNNKKEEKQKGDKDNKNKDKKPPQQPTNTKKTCADEARILLLRQRLKKLLDRIRQRREQGPMQLDRRFQTESFHMIFNIVSELISNGHTVSINSDNFSLEISARDGSWREEIEYQIIDDLNVHGQLTHQRGFPRNPGARCQPGGRILCCGFLVAQFQQGSQLVLSQQENYSGRPIIYGARCRLCHNGGLACRISYVGLTERSAHARLCGEHARAARDLINQRANEEEPEDRPMYEHVALHLENGDLPEGTLPRDAFREVLDIILLPISGGPDELRSWEVFWQFFFHCRKFFWGWSQR